MKIEEIKVIIEKSSWSSKLPPSEIEVLAHYGDGSVLVGYVDHFRGLGDRIGNNRRVAFINAAKQIKWDMIAITKKHSTLNRR